jgi:DNA-binding MarR family transcriptional regulator
LVSEIQPEPEQVSVANVEQAMASSTLRLLRRLLDVAQQSGPALARRASLTHHELTALEMLTRQAWGPGELARHLGVTSAAASGIVDRLVARGHVERRPHEADRRRTQVLLTDSGRKEVLGHLMPMFIALDELDRGLTEEERAVVDRYLTGATEAIERIV